MEPMGLMDEIKKFFGPGEKRMALGQFTIVTPLPHVRYFYDLERAAKKLKLNGWMNRTPDGQPTGELEGPLETIRIFFNQVESGQIIPGKNTIETMLPPYRHKYISFQMKFVPDVNATNAPNTATGGSPNNNPNFPS